MKGDESMIRGLHLELVLSCYGWRGFSEGSSVLSFLLQRKSNMNSSGFKRFDIKIINYRYTWYLSACALSLLKPGSDRQVEGCTHGNHSSSHNQWYQHRSILWTKWPCCDKTTKQTQINCMDLCAKFRVAPISQPRIVLILTSPT